MHQYDAQADTHALLDTSGAVEAQYKYNAFGKVQAVSVAGGPWTAEDWQDLPLDLTSNMLAGGKKQSRRRLKFVNQESVRSTT